MTIETFTFIYTICGVVFALASMLIYGYLNRGKLDSDDAWFAAFMGVIAALFWPIAMVLAVMWALVSYVSRVPPTPPARDVPEDSDKRGSYR